MNALNNSSIFNGRRSRCEEEIEGRDPVPEHPGLVFGIRYTVRPRNSRYNPNHRTLDTSKRKKRKINNELSKGTIESAIVQIFINLVLSDKRLLFGFFLRSLARCFGKLCHPISHHTGIRWRDT